MPRTSKFSALFLTLIALVLAGCDSREIGQNTTAVERDDIRFVRAGRSFRFGGKAYATGMPFELVSLKSGRKMVVLAPQKNPQDVYTILAGPLIFPQTSTNALIVDERLCATGEFAFFNHRSSPQEGQTVGQFLGYTTTDPAPLFESGTDVCFTKT